MKLKCKLILTAVFALSILLAGTNIQAQHKHKQPHANAKKKVAHHKKVIHNKNAKVVHKNNVASSIKVIKRTNHVIINAHKAVKKYKVYSGDLAKAVHHQQHAKKLIKTGKMHRSMQHSRLARTYAFKAIRMNKGTMDAAYQFNAEDKKVMGEAITNVELEKELKASNPSIKFDDAAVSDKEMSELEVLDVAPSDYKNE